MIFKNGYLSVPIHETNLIEALRNDPTYGKTLKMKATLKPLTGKYYGTEVVIDFQDGESVEVLKLWNNSDFQPSVRELDKHGYTQEQWDNNEEVDNGWGGKTEIRKMDLTSDSHFESKLTYERALKLVNLINRA
jgi:hypothetical protein